MNGAENSTEPVAAQAQPHCLPSANRPRCYGIGILVSDITVPRRSISHDYWTAVVLNDPPSGINALTSDLCRKLRRQTLYLRAKSDGTGWITGELAADLRPPTGLYFVTLSTGKLLLVERKRAGSIRYYWPVIRRIARTRA